jgi:hypothetical protein
METKKRDLLSGRHMDRDKKTLVEGGKDAKALDCVSQAGDDAASGGLRTASGKQGKLTASTPVENGEHDKVVIKVGTIGCSAFGLNESLTNAVSVPHDHSVGSC